MQVSRKVVPHSRGQLSCHSHVDELFFIIYFSVKGVEVPNTTRWFEWIGGLCEVRLAHLKFSVDLVPLTVEGFALFFILHYREGLSLGLRHFECLFKSVWVNFLKNRF